MGQGPCVPWYYQWWGIALTVLGLGPFSLYFVWRSPRLTPTGRWIGFILIGAFTAYLVWSFFVTMNLLKTALSGVSLNIGL